MKKIRLATFLKFIAVSLSTAAIITMTGCSDASQKTSEPINNEDQKTSEAGPVSLEDHEPNPAGDFGYNIENDEVIIYEYKGTDPVVVIPENIEGKPVTKVAMLVFSSRSLSTEVTAVKFPSGVKEISMDCFNFNKTITVVDASHVEHISGSAFSGCESLQTLKLSDSLKGLDAASIFECPNLKEIYISPSVQEIKFSSYPKEQDLFMNMNETLTITGKAGSFIEEWAKTFGINFKAV